MRRTTSVASRNDSVRGHSVLDTAKSRNRATVSSATWLTQQPSSLKSGTPQFAAPHSGRCGDGSHPLSRATRRTPVSNPSSPPHIPPQCFLRQGNRLLNTIECYVNGQGEGYLLTGTEAMGSFMMPNTSTSPHSELSTQTVQPLEVSVYT